MLAKILILYPMYFDVKKAPFFPFFLSSLVRILFFFNFILFLNFNSKQIFLEVDHYILGKPHHHTCTFCTV